MSAPAVQPLLRPSWSGFGAVAQNDQRRVRPITVEAARPVRPTADGCPFCAGGRADDEPAHVMRSTSSNRVKALSNAFPLSQFHELLLLGEGHEDHLHHLDGDHLTAIVDVLEQRVRQAWTAGPPHATAWMSYGAQAGASQDHPHIQVAAFDTIPPGVAQEATQVADPCAVCTAPRVGRFGNVAVLAPVSDMDGELVLAPVQHGGTLPAVEHAVALGAATRTLRELFPSCPYNVVWHTYAPTGHPGQAHQHVHVLPRLTIVSAVNMIEGWFECRTIGDDLVQRAAPTFLAHAALLEAGLRHRP